MEIKMNPNESGLNEEESKCLNLSVELWNSLHALDFDDEDATQLTTAINNIQRILAYQIVKRQYPKFWQ